MSDLREVTPTNRTFIIGLQPQSGEDSYAEIQVSVSPEGRVDLKQGGDLVILGGRQVADLLKALAACKILGADR